MKVKLIAACSKNGVLGQNNKIPWNYPEDLNFFRKMTKDASVVMGYYTYQSIGSKPLPKRHNIVVTSRPLENVEHCDNLYQAIQSCPEDKTVWIIGGANIYREGLLYADELFITCIPQTITGNSLVYFPWIDPLEFRINNFIPLDAERKQLAVVAHYIRNKCRICALNNNSNECSFETHEFNDSADSCDSSNR